MIEDFLNILRDDSGVESVWLKIWQGVVGASVVIWQGFLNFVSGNLWTVEVETNESFPVGDVNYTVYANDSAGNVNDSETGDYTIDKATPTASITNDTALTKTYDEVITNVGISESNGGDGDVNYVLWKDDVNIGNSDSEGSVGTYNYKINTTGGENYSAVSDMDSESLVIK